MFKKLSMLLAAFGLGVMMAPKSGKDTRGSIKKWAVDKKKELLKKDIK